MLYYYELIQSTVLIIKTFMHGECLDEIRILRFTICNMIYVCAANEHIQTNKLSSKCGKNLPASIVTLNKERGN